MAVIANKGKVGLYLQADRLGYLSKDGAPSPNVIRTYPANRKIMAINATSVDVGPAIDQRMLETEVGGTLFPSGAVRLGYSVAGTWSIQPRLEDNFGWILYMLFGRILAEYYDPVRGIGEHTFIMDETKAAGDLPWATFVKYMPGLGEASDAFEFHEDSRIVQAAINVPANGLVTVDLTERGRVLGLSGQQKLVDRTILIGPVPPAAATTMDTATGGTVNTLVDSTKTWPVNGLVGARVFISKYGYRTILQNTATEITFSPATGSAVVTGDDYLIDAPIWKATTADGTTTTLVDTGFVELVADVLIGQRVYISGVGFRTITDNEAAATGVITLDQPLPSAALTGTDYCLAMHALGGNIRSVRVNPVFYGAVTVNDWISIDGKGIRRVIQKVVDEDGFYVIRIDGEFADEVQADDAMVILSPTHPSEAGTVRTVVDTVGFITEGQYADYVLELWDANGDSIGAHRVTGTIAATHTCHVDGDYAIATAAAQSYALYMPELAFEWLPKECPATIPQSPFPQSTFRVLNEPFGGKKQPVRQVTLTVGYQVLPVEREMLVGAYEMDDITVQGATPTQLKYTYRVKSQELYTRIMTGGSIEAYMKRFDPKVFTSDVYLSTAAPVEVTAGHYYRAEFFFPNVAWQLDGAPQLRGNEVVELQFTGQPFEPCGTVNPIYGPFTGPTVNTVTGSLTHASLDAMVETDLIGRIVRITSGTGAGQVREIKAYRDGTGNGTIIPQRPWITDPDGTSIFVIEAHYGLVTLTNGRHAYGDDVPTLV